jgi:hypothetical protein
MDSASAFRRVHIICRDHGRRRCPSMELAAHLQVFAHVRSVRSRGEEPLAADRIISIGRVRVRLSIRRVGRDRSRIRDCCRAAEADPSRHSRKRFSGRKHLYPHPVSATWLSPVCTGGLRGAGGTILELARRARRVEHSKLLHSAALCDIDCQAEISPLNSGREGYRCHSSRFCLSLAFACSLSRCSIRRLAGSPSVLVSRGDPWADVSRSIIPEFGNELRKEVGPYKLSSLGLQRSSSNARHSE